MADARYSERQVGVALRIHQIEEENKRLRRLIGDLPFNKLIRLQAMWEKQRQKIQEKRRLNRNSR